MVKIMQLLNIRDYYGRVYYPEVMYSVCYNFSGVDSAKLNSSFQMHYYLKKLRKMYRGLGKQAKWADLYGTKNRNQKKNYLTAAESIAARMILYKWRNFKN